MTSNLFLGSDSTKGLKIGISLDAFPVFLGTGLATVLFCGDSFDAPKVIYVAPEEVGLGAWGGGWEYDDRL